MAVEVHMMRDEVVWWRMENWLHGRHGENDGTIESIRKRWRKLPAPSSQERSLPTMYKLNERTHEILL